MPLWSSGLARHSVTVEVAGSNPVRAAFGRLARKAQSEPEALAKRKLVTSLTLQARKEEDGTVRQLAERPSSNLGMCGFDSHPCY